MIMSQTGQRLGTAILLVCLIIGCNDQESEQKALNIEEIDALTPEKIWAIDHVEDLYFSHLGYESVILENGNIAFADRELPTIVVLNEDGELIKNIRSGRGPGEILDAYYFTKGISGNIFTYDQSNDKILLYDEDFEHIRDIIPKKFESHGILKVYPVEGKNEYLLQMSSSEYLWDESREREIVLVRYNSESNTFGQKMALTAQPYALLKIDGNIMGAAKVPYAYGNITAYDFKKGSVFTFDTGTEKIAELNADFDSLRTTSVILPSEMISRIEMDSIEASYDIPEQWETIKEALPEEKSPADKMMYHKGEFWLKSNIEAKTVMWLVVNEEGKVRNVVHLPKESMLTHIDDDHLGVRLDDVTFALYSNPVSGIE